jgi:NADPH2:quinone reductase
MKPVRAWQVERHGEPRDVLQAVTVDGPVPGPGEIRVRVAAAAVGLPDVLMCRGTYAFSPPLPFVPGQEVSGVVEASGDGVEVVPGTRVMGVTSFYDGRGGLAAETILAAANAFRVPEDMTAADAASFRIGFSTAWAALVRRGGLMAGESLLVLGAAGGSGQAAVQLGHALGARVIAVAAGPERLAFCRGLGADVTIDRMTESVPDAVLAATDGRGADLVFDPVGGAPATEAARALAPRGRFLAVGFASGAWVTLETQDLVRRNQSLVGVLASGPSREDEEADHEALLALAAGGALASRATTVAFDDVPDALEQVAAGSATGKLVVEVDGA